MAKKNDWVQVHITVLTPAERATNIPEDTRKVPLELWVKGKLLEESAELGDMVTVRTKTGRTVSGTLCTVAPCFTHTFGDYVPELDEVDEMVKTLLFGGEQDA